ncbi:hypothetical protein BDV25DRAFT_138601 [Aspergillus avenaceus]|uniref:Uncharacterized protein n=1 Tax=Aspergillus avenaceus TaxID=36643 RepID=A0A5N6TZ67_ASPAV|nr:hypothetical protein BDV25DRAFT_138601 [Aspergillus avenaceus]
MEGYGGKMLLPLDTWSSSRAIESIYHDHMIQRNLDAIHLGYFYAGFAQSQESDKAYRDMLMTFWEQVQKQGSFNTFGSYWSLNKIENAVQKLLIHTGRNIYIAVDAVDQFSSASQTRLIEWLKSLANEFANRETKGRLRMLQVEVTANNNSHDIDTYLEENLHSDLFDETPSLRKEAFDNLRQRADGMFLWVRLQTLNIREMEVERQVRNALSSSESIQDLYATHAEGFETEKELTRRQIAQLTMALLAHNMGSMPKDMLFVALSLSRNGSMDTTDHSDLVKQPDLVVRFCNHLIHIDRELGIVQFFHSTAYEFFQAFKAATYNYRIAELCLCHLSSPDFSVGARRDATWYSPGIIESLLQNHPFLQFASARWATSIKQSLKGTTIVTLEETHRTVLSLLQGLSKEQPNVGNLALGFQVYLLHLRRKAPRGISHEHILSYFGLWQLLHIFIKKEMFNLEMLDDDGLTPIHWAIQNEMHPCNAAFTVKELIRCGARIQTKDKRDRTPLYYAALYGNIRAISLLVRNGARLDSMDQRRETALIAACQKHHEKVILYLIKAGADVTLQSSSGTALQAVSSIGCTNCAGAIIERHQNKIILETGGPFGTSLHAAAFYGHWDLVKLLCSQKKVNVHATHEIYGTPLTAAIVGWNPGLAERPFVQIISELIRRGAKVNDPNGMVGPALRAESDHGSPILVRLLLENGAKVRKARGQLGSAYEAASDGGHQDVKDLLLKSDPKAAKYDTAYNFKISDRHGVQQILFKTALKTSGMNTIHMYADQAEGFHEKVIRSGNISRLKSIAKVSEEAFQDVVELATGTKSNSKVQMSDRTRRRRRETKYRLFCINLAERTRDQPLRTSTNGQRPSIRRVTTSFFNDDPGAHFPQVLDRMTQSAVRIMEHAIASNNADAIDVVSKIWFRIVRTSLSSTCNIQARIRTKGYKKAKTLAQIGIELLIAAVGQRFQRLSFVISKLWIKAVNGVADLGETGDAAVHQLIRLFEKRFLYTVSRNDQVNAEICAQAGIELLRATVLVAKPTLLDQFSDKVVELFSKIIEGQMQAMINNLIKSRWKEYHNLWKDSKADEALSIPIVAIEVFRKAIQLNYEPAESELQPYIESGTQLSGDGDNFNSSIPWIGIEAQAQRIGLIFDAAVNLFATSEKMQPYRLNSIGSNILRAVAALPKDRIKDLEKVIDERIKRLGQINDNSRDAAIMEMSRAIFVFLELTLCDPEGNDSLLSTFERVALKELLKIYPKFIENDELAQYTEAMKLFRSKAPQYTQEGKGKKRQRRKSSSERLFLPAPQLQDFSS